MKEHKNALWQIGSVIVVELLVVAFLVWFFDPFYQYHAPFAGMQAVLNDRDNQVPGTIRTFDYDSVLVGSSVAENCDSTYLDQAYGCKTLKVIKASGSTADLLYYMDMVHEKVEPVNVFYCLDITALMADTETVLYGEEFPRYLHTKSIVDDGTYVFNKEVLLEKIPMMLAFGKLGRNTGGQAYDWSLGKNFSPEQAMRAYEKPEVESESRDFSQDIDRIETNLKLLVSEVEAHPETTYHFFLPTYSLLWWDSAKVNGMLEEYEYVLENALMTLVSLENAEVHDFQIWQDIACDLNHYMDMIHYDPSVNQRMLEAMACGECKVTEETIPEFLEKTRAMVDYMCDTKILEYY